ncbi:collagenase-like protease [Chryseomicrobium excrementi]|uniref:Collagenase-like protease n=1 Tax=Chryseomicrobium excrementi TaxID=2041346 RepID=A0A2M9F229_9BACL|nr:peptidase U32 family protein [Chryseomicrobium excrementi]PJK17520.1 collagenase-like protease [Chryseomicrobium excrementi]
MTEILVTPTTIDHAKALFEAGADAVVVGEQQFGLRLAGEFSLESIAQVKELATTVNKKVYVAVNALFHNDRVNALEAYMRQLEVLQVDGIYFGDPAVLMTHREISSTIPLFWNSEQTATNYFTANYWGERGASRAYLARELSMDEILEIKENADVEVEIQVHGMSCMFQSKRPLLGHYFLYQGKAMEIENRTQQKNMLLFDKERGNRYPIYEDLNGTHIFSPNDMCIIDELEELLEADIDAFRIEGLLQTEEYTVAVTKLYRQALDAYANSPKEYRAIKQQLLSEIENRQQTHRPIDTGFFFKESVY